MVVHARRSAEAAEAVANEIRALGRQAEVLLADLNDTAQQDALVDRAWSWRDGIDIWVNNAGADVLTGEPADWSFERKWEELVRVDITATMRIGRRAGRLMKSRGQGVLLNMGWDQAQRGMEGDSGELFAAAKGAVMAFSKSLAMSLAPEVRVNCLAPGWIKTGWGDEASEAWQQRACRESLLGRWGAPADVARAARFLVSNEAGFLDGQVLAINGGFKES